MTDSAGRDPREATLALLARLIRHGRELLTRDPESAYRVADVRIWQNDCAVAVNELSGGSKAHWLSRAYSSALLVRAMDGGAIVEADVAEIVFRVIDVLEQARRSVAGMDTAAPSVGESQEPHRFDFVRDAEVRPVLEQAYVDSRRAYETGDFGGSLMTACGIMEAIITDALKVHPTVRLTSDTTKVAASELEDAVSDVAEARGFSRTSSSDISDWSFDERIAAAEAAGLIRGGCARLPAIARGYRDASAAVEVSERDAKIARQVMHVVMRDLDPGR